MSQAVPPAPPGHLPPPSGDPPASPARSVAVTVEDARPPVSEAAASLPPLPPPRIGGVVDDGPPVLEHQDTAARPDSEFGCDRPWNLPIPDSRAADHFRAVLGMVSSLVGFDPVDKPRRKERLSMASLSTASAALQDEDKENPYLVWPMPKSVSTILEWVTSAAQGGHGSQPSVQHPFADKSLRPGSSWIKPLADKMIGSWRFFGPVACVPAHRL